MFTSGSTGQPKGVTQTQRNLLQVVRRYTNNMYLEPNDIYSLLSSCSVTAAAGAILSALLNGVTLAAFPLHERGLAELADWIDEQRISIYHSVPSLFRHLMTSVDTQRIFSKVRLVRVGGDSVYKSDWELFKQHFPPESAFVQFYGCSEISSISRFYTDVRSVLPENIVPAGYSLDEVEIRLADENGLDRPVASEANLGQLSDEVGEIVLRSQYLSPGYWPDVPRSIEALTHARTYRTGDLGAVRSEQGLIHVGRGDLQVKVSGFRVEIGEIEACLRSFPGVKEAAVVVHTPAHGERILVGFVVVEHPNAETESKITAHARARLPPHMVPSDMAVVDELPFTPNGKIDRRALAALAARISVTKPRQSVAPSSQTEVILAEIWGDVLSRKDISIDAGFFELGGNSMLGMRVAARTAESFGVNVAVHSIIQYPTIRQLARLVESLRSASRSEPELNDADVEEGTI